MYSEKELRRFREHTLMVVRVMLSDEESEVP
jgi:hypothetical protein